MITIFGELFSKILVTRFDSSGNSAKVLKVPIIFGQKNQWYYKNVSDPNYGNTSFDPGQITQRPIDAVFPRMVYTLGPINRDPSRKIASINRQVSGITSDPSSINKIYAPVPVYVGLNLSIICNELDDILQIVEQIVPNFTPDFNVPAHIKKELGFTSDIGFTLEYPIDIQDNWAGKLDEKREITVDISFIANCEIYGNVGEQGLIRHVMVNIRNKDTDVINAAIDIVPNPSDESPTASPVLVTTQIQENG